MIPVNEPYLSNREKELLCECIDTGWVSSEGPFVKKFENDFAKYIGHKYGIAVCNGTAALEVGLHAIGVGEGDEVIMPSFTIISCALAVLRLGAKPVLVDIVPDIWNMDVSQIESKITNKTKAIMPVHIYGHSVDMDPLMEIAKKYNLKVIEDASQAHGTEYKGQRLGSIGEVSTFSFYANKIISCGEGGMILTSSEEMMEKAKKYRNLYFEPEKRFLHQELGYNFRMTNLQAAIGVAQMEKIDYFVETKRKFGKYYRQKLQDVAGIRFQEEKSWCKSVYWMYSIEIDKDINLEAPELMEKLREKGIGSRPFFLGLHEQPAFHKRGLFVGESYPHTEFSARKGLYLPSGLTLTEGQVDTVCNTLEQIMMKYKSPS